ncbi:MAG: TIGR03862 family flavoprotein [Pseudorhodobacter sp.]|nr:TIGR03862 family flavoprotein [Rhizobacter sp.]
MHSVETAVVTNVETAARGVTDAALPITARVAVVGGGPAGLMAAEVLALGGVQVDLFDAMPSVGRKFLLAGRGGLNLTHSEAFAPFAQRYAARSSTIAAMLNAFGPAQLREWALGLGVSTFVGSSGRVFPTDLKAAPLLRGWLHRLRQQGVRFHMRHRWLGWDGAGALRFSTPVGDHCERFDAVLLALGGGSWARLGSDGAWVPLLRQHGVEVAALLPSNCGFDVTTPASTRGWSDHFRSRFAGHPLKNVALRFHGLNGVEFQQAGEFVITEGGVEGNLIYAASGPVRDALIASGEAVVQLDLLPQRDAAFVAAEVARPRGSRSLATHLKSRLGLDGVKAALIYELLPREVVSQPAALAAAIKALPLKMRAARPIDEAISSAGGVRFEGMNDALMLLAQPGVFCAGEMLDWEAPTGGYLLTACLASGHCAGQGVLRFLQQPKAHDSWHVERA